MDHDQRLRDIIEQLPSAKAMWNSFLREAVWATECASGVLLVTDRRDGGNNHSGHLYNVPMTHKQQYEAGLNAVDRFNQLLAERADQVLYSQDWDLQRINEQVEGDFMQPFGYSHRLGVSISCNRRYAINLYLNRDSAFSGSERARGETLLSGVLQPLRAALEAERRQAFARALFLESGVLDDFIGFAIINEHLHLVHQDQGFAEMARDMLGLYFEGGRLRCDDGVLCGRLRSILDGGERHCVELSSVLDSHQLLALPSQLLGGLLPWEHPGDGILLALYGVERRRFVGARLRSVYGLTNAEVALVLDFAQQPSLSDLAEARHRSIDTLRNHLKRAMQKLDIHSQAELVRMVMAFTLP